jgi:hypothetical protein
MPLLREHYTMLAYHSDYARNLVCTKAPALCDLKGLQPNLDRRISFINMDMRWLVWLVAEKIEAKAVLAMDGWHNIFLSPTSWLL